MADSDDEIPEDWCTAGEIAAKARVPWSSVLMYAGRYPDILPSRKAKNGRRWFPPEAVQIVIRLSKEGKSGKPRKRRE